MPFLSAMETRLRSLAVPGHVSFPEAFEASTTFGCCDLTALDICHMARNLRQVHDLTLTRVRESTVVADFADVDMHAPPAFIMFMGSQEKEIRSFSSRE